MGPSAGESVKSLMASVAGSLRRIGRDDVSAISVLLLLSSLVRPYAGLTHDAKLYAVQVLNSVQPGDYSQDLFLHFGSQGRFTLFSAVAGPLVQLCGLRPTFYALYVASLAFFMWAGLRFVRRLIGHRLTAFLAMVFFAVNPVTFGGFGIFHVSESFLTPRLAATALVLCALERMVCKKWIVSLALLLAAMACHPLMSVSGLLVWCYCMGLSVISARTMRIVLLLTILAAATTLISAPLGTAVYGEMDSTWNRLVRDANPYLVPDQWLPRDWLCVALAFSISIAARMRLRLDDSRRQLIDSLLLVSAVGVIVGWTAPFLPYALLLQGQPYRALWLVHFLQVPLGVELCRQLAAGHWRRNRKASFVLATGFAAAYLSVLQSLLNMWLLCLFFLSVTRSLLSETRFRATAVVLVTFALVVPLWEEALGPKVQQVDVVARHLPRTGSEPHVVYWAMADVDAIWFDLKATSYFSLAQLSGNVFNRGTAIEGHRRARIVAPFELAELFHRSRGTTTWKHDLYRQVFGEASGAPPALDDLYRLCREDIDLAVLRHRFGDYYVASVGPWYLYDCRAIRGPLAAELSSRWPDDVTPLAQATGEIEGLADDKIGLIVTESR